MTWNHRVIRHKTTSGHFYYGVHEVYYDETGKPDTWTVDPINLVGDSVEDIREELLMILKALDIAPVLVIMNDSELKEI